MEHEIQMLERRAFESWEQDVIPQLINGMSLTRVGCATFTMKKAKHRHPKQFQTMMDRYFCQQARLLKRHIVWMFGQTGIGAVEKTHQHGDIFFFNKEGAVQRPEVDRWLLEQRFKFGRCLIEEKKEGNWSGYSMQKHDGENQILKVYCPKIGECGQHTKRKGDRRFCVYQREAIKL